VIRHVLAHEGERLKAIRLHSLQADPRGFGSSHARELAYAEDWWTSRAALSEAGEEQRCFVLVDEEDRWLGMALARDDAGQAVLNGMWVAPEARGRGAARQLCDACADWARDRGFPALDVAVFPDNAAAGRLYASAGFTPHRETDSELILRRTL
jgi:GNAT superfamily N-acetyltransferase